MNTETLHLILSAGLVAAAAALDVAANLMLARSDGFKKRLIGIAALALVGLAFYCLSLAVQYMDLAVAYSMWGSLGILGTSLCGWLFLRQRLKPRHSLVADTAQGACGHNHAQQHRRPQPVKESRRQPFGQQALQQRHHRRQPRTRQRERQHHPKHLTHGRPPPGTIWLAAPRCRLG